MTGMTNRLTAALRQAGFMLGLVRLILMRALRFVLPRGRAPTAAALAQPLLPDPDDDQTFEALMSGSTAGLSPQIALGQDSFGQPWLFHAIDFGTVTALDWILAARNGCDQGALTLTDRAGRGVLQAAIERSLSVDEFVLIGTDQEDAASVGQDMLTVLVARGANVNALDPQGLRPLHVAVSLQAEAAARQLLSLGADASLTDARGLRPIDYAQSAKDASMAELLA